MFTLGIPEVPGLASTTSTHLGKPKAGKFHAYVGAEVQGKPGCAQFSLYEQFAFAVLILASL